MQNKKKEVIGMREEIEAFQIPTWAEMETLVWASALSSLTVHYLGRFFHKAEAKTSLVSEVRVCLSVSN